jgi:hypothetical protein
MKGESAFVQALEGRLLFSTPSTPRAASVGPSFDAADRQSLLARLTHIDKTTRADLQAKLKVSVGQFDSALLSYMRHRSGPEFYFDPAGTGTIGKFIKTHDIIYSDLTDHTDAVADSHKFPEQTNSPDYTIDLQDKINWITPGGSSNPEFKHSLNRMMWFEELAWAAAITGDPGYKYAHEMEYELASWSQQNPTQAPPSVWNSGDQKGWFLDSAIRADTWTWGYFGFLDSPAFTPAENSLFLYKLTQNGDYLNKSLANIDPSMFSSNRTVSAAKGLLMIGDMFPEIDNASKWQKTAHTSIFKCMDVQIYSDGSHVEQSPGYAYNVADDIIEVKWLDQLNGVSWPTAYRNKLTNMIDAYVQELSPNGKRPAIGDTFRTNSFGVFLKADTIQGTTRWPISKPRVRDFMLLGVDRVKPYINYPGDAHSLGARGTRYALKNSGNYIMRSGNDARARQINFDAGPTGGVHGHYDLLNFELSGFGRPLISDPGAYKYDDSKDRQYVLSTKAHNTINVDGLNHAAVADNDKSTILVSQWDGGANFAQVTASHRAYDYLPGHPVLTRSIWFNLDDTMIVVDWGLATKNHTYTQSFNLTTEGDDNNVQADPAHLTARSRYLSGGNVQIHGLSRPGETLAKGPKTFVSNTASGSFKDDAYRITMSQTGKYVCFVTLITTYAGTQPPDVSAKLLNNPLAKGGVAKVQLTRDGKSQLINFQRPPLMP